MEKVILIDLDRLFFLSDPTYAQWQLIVSQKPDHEITPVDPSEPDNKSL